MLSILKFPELTLEYQTYDIVEMTEEYIPFYLAFREVKHLVKLFERCKEERGDRFPQVVFVDGGGVWHPKGMVSISFNSLKEFIFRRFKEVCFTRYDFPFHKSRSLLPYKSLSLLPFNPPRIPLPPPPISLTLLTLANARFAQASV